MRDRVKDRENTTIIRLEELLTEKGGRRENGMVACKCNSQTKRID